MKLFLGFILALTSTLGFPSEYEVEPCCNLCPAALDDASYQDGVLKYVKRLVDGQDGWLFRTENDFMQTFGPNPLYQEQLHQLTQLFRSEGTEVAFFYIPTRGLMQFDKVIDARSVGFDWSLARANYLAAMDSFRKAGMLVPDLSSVIKKSSTEDEYFFRRDHHWSPNGAKLSAQLLAEEVKKHALFDDLDHKQFKNRKVGYLRRRGQLQHAAKRLCGFDYPDQFVDKFAVELIENREEGSLDDALFGDQSGPEVVLLGTSNSKGRQNFNFAGFLSEYLSVDLYNEAVEGGGYDAAMLQYLNSDLYRDEKPKLIIWEVPSYYDFNEEDFFRQVKPLIKDGCQGKPSLLVDNTVLRQGKNELLFNGGGEVKNLRSGNLVIDMQFSDVNTREIDLRVWYVNGRSESLKIEHSPRISTGGRFVFETKSLGDWKDFLYLSLDLDVSDEIAPRSGDKVSVTMCNKAY